ncbi:MAG: hypothetical protein HKP48_01660 [Winogradskyella sp.]|uniref:hypothetical protein n=1 Tax=Winogradskyella sp. TaxID=1883156 RepID=UPI00181AAB05|nr:hypothetical protein [Winogradskyella sp.]MBT8243784.1 hypothetical protein [Winogradskyella sp.]NNK22024.1 hypothetical protein [Winogradskyella sp.]
MSQIKLDLPLNQKLTHYQTASIIRYALIEGPAILCFIITLISEQVSFLIIGWCILVYMYTIRPTKDKVLKDLRLSLEERIQLSK